MKIEGINKRGVEIAVVSSEQVIITDVRSALDLIMTVKYQTGSERIVVNKEAITSDFFILSRGLAGEILQKFINYHVKFAVYGDFSKYNSKPLKDFIYESNKGKDIFFTKTREEAVDKISNV